MMRSNIKHFNIYVIRIPSRRERLEPKKIRKKKSEANRRTKIVKVRAKTNK